MISRYSTLAEVINHNPLLELVLDRFGLRELAPGLCLELAGEGRCPDIDFFVEILRIFDQPDTFDASRLQRYPVPVVLDYLEKTHRYYTHKRICEIEQSLDRLAAIHGTEHPLLILLHTFFASYSRQLEGHIEMEEETLFPYIRRLLRLREVPPPTEGDEFDHYSLDEFILSHGEDELDEQIRMLRRWVEVRHPEVLEILPFKILAGQLNAFELDLMIHERIEDEVLIPLARQLENDE